MSEQKPGLTEDEIQDLINRSKAGVPAAQKELINKFEGFLSKYVNILYHSRYDSANYDSRKFIALFVADGVVRRHLLRNSLNPGGRRHVQKCLDDIEFMVKRYGCEEDVRQTVEMTFWQCVYKYERTESKSKPGEWVPFSGFLYNYFYYMLKKNVDAFLIDQLGLKTFPLIMADEMGDSEESELKPGYTEPVEEPETEDLFGPEILDEYWVIGDTALFPFDQLSRQDRQLVKWRYIDGLKSSEIANRITEHPNTVREHFNRIRGILEELVAEFDSLDKVC